MKIWGISGALDVIEAEKKEQLRESPRYIHRKLKDSNEYQLLKKRIDDLFKNMMIHADSCCKCELCSVVKNLKAVMAAIEAE